ncbi:MAG TPA: DUF378 domain-containing protein [Geobacteraceae bacterium]|nr:DUF378 domain-containing protein [Geobacteraceae bacterium]
MKVLDVCVWVLLLIGGLNWGLMGFFNFNLIGAIFGEASAFSRFIYALVGLSALYEFFGFTFQFKEIQHRWCEMPTEVKH